MSKLKLGDRVWKSGTIVQGQHGLKWASYPELGDQDGHLIPDAPNLAAVARVLADHGSAVTAAVEMAYVDSVERGDRKELSDALRELTAALNGNGE